MIIVDKISLITFFIIIKIIIKNKFNKIEVGIIENQNSKFLFFFFSFLMKKLDISTKILEFYAGHCFTQKNENIWTKARHIMEEISFEIARNEIKKKKWIYNLNNYWEKNTITLFLSKFFFEKIEYKKQTITKFLIADMFIRKSLSKNKILIIERPKYFDETFLRYKDNFNKKIWYNNKFHHFNETKIFGIFIISYKLLGALLNDFLKLKKKSILKSNSKPKLLLTKEDDLSMDRSHRSQPHWIFKEDIIQKYEIIILNDKYSQDEKNYELRDKNINIIDKEKIKSLSLKTNEQKKVFNILIKLLFKKNESYLNELIKLHLDTFFYLGFCTLHNIKGFMSSENYDPITSVMNMISSKNIIKTFSYQYSNLSRIVNPTMQTTADYMFTFSDLYHKRYSYNECGPRKLLSIGYIYSSSFKLIKNKKEIIKKNLCLKDEDFVITYFDENYQSDNDKFGFFSKSDYCNEIQKLSKYSEKNKTVKVISKSQFVKNTASIVCFNSKLKSLINDRKWLEPTFGNFRNSIFPSEASIFSEIAIGQAVGGTAALEAALLGKRCILINPQNIKNENLEIMKNENIIFSNIDEALEAIEQYRMGDLNFKNLGDWERIIHNFDNFRDEKTSDRIKEKIENLMLN